jgi:hypothetical protein
VWERIVLLFSDEELIQEMLEAHEQMRRSERGREDADLASLISSEQSVKAEEARYLDAYGKGVISIDQLQEQMTGIRRQKEALARTRSEIDEPIQQRDKVKAQAATIKHLVARAKAGLHLFGFEDRRAFLEAIRFKGVVDGEADTIWIDGLITIPPVSLSGKADNSMEVGAHDERLQLHTGHREPVQRERGRK